MKKLYISFSIFLMLIITVDAQTTTVTNDYRRDKNAEYDLSDFIGSKYLEDDFQVGSIEDELTNISKNVFLRYDVYSDIFERKDSQATSAFTYLEKTYGVNVFYDDRTFIYTNYINDLGNQVIGYLEVLGKYEDLTFYMDFEKTLRMPQKSPSPQTPDRAGKIGNKEFFVLKSPQGTKVIDISRKDVQDLFPQEVRGQVKSYVKKNKLKFRDGEDMKNLLDHLNK